MLQRVATGVEHGEVVGDGFDAIAGQIGSAGVIDVAVLFKAGCNHGYANVHSGSCSLYLCSAFHSGEESLS
jgi:hypothetical protein